MKSTNITAIIYLFIFFLLPYEVLHGKENKFITVDESKRLIREVLEEERQQKEMDNFLKDSAASNNMLFHGYADLEWKSEGFNRGDGSARGHSFFDNHHFNLWLGYLLADNLIAKSEIEIEHGGEKFKLEFGDIEWKPFHNDRLEIFLGKILVPLGIENPVHASVWNKLVSRPLPSISIIPGTFADIGFALRGRSNLFSNYSSEYNFYVINGIGDPSGNNIYNQSNIKSTRDNNRNKAIGFQLSFLKSNIFNTGFSGYFGTWDKEDKHSTYILVGHIAYNNSFFDLRSEYIYQDIERPNGAAGLKNGILNGYYIQGAYKLSSLNLNYLFNSLELILRYDSINNLGNIQGLKQGGIGQGNKENRVVSGLIARPQEWLQLKLEYLIRNGYNLNNTNGIAFQTVANW